MNKCLFFTFFNSIIPGQEIIGMKIWAESRVQTRTYITVYDHYPGVSTREERLYQRFVKKMTEINKEIW